VEANDADAPLRIVKSGTVQFDAFRLAETSMGGRLYAAIDAPTVGLSFEGQDFA
jgi:hypothetical protein